jgi:8-oxo-dGTP diphosphatase
MVTWGEHILLIRRDVEPMRGFWALPGGYMDAGEMPAAALERELFEEVGLEVEVGDLIEIFPMVGPGGPSGGIVLAFRVGVESTAMPELACNDDVCESAWFGPDNLPSELAFESTITLLERWRDASR